MVIKTLIVPKDFILGGWPKMCVVLDIANSRDAVSRLKNYEKKGVILTDTLGKNPQTYTCVSGSGLNKLKSNTLAL